MADAVWPADLPQDPFGNDDPTYVPLDNVQRTQQEGGVFVARVLFTAVPERLTVVLKLNPAQRQVLRAFIQDTLQYVAPFTWKDFRKGIWPTYVPGTYRYASTALPTEKYLGADASGTWWQVQFDLELQP